MVITDAFGQTDHQPDGVGAPAITKQPLDINATMGSNVLFSPVNGTQPLTYQWQKHSNSSVFVDILGAQARPYFTGVDLNIGAYRDGCNPTDKLPLSLPNWCGSGPGDYQGCMIYLPLRQQGKLDHRSQWHSPLHLSLAER